MASDPFDGLLDLEENFYKEGYDAGLADGEHAGLVEGKVFGLEKGYEKALEMGKLRGRAIVWQSRSRGTDSAESSQASASTSDASHILSHLRDSRLPKNTRLTKHIEGFLSVTDEKSMATDNSDESVTDFDDRISKAQAKAKVIAAIVAESVDSESSVGATTGIEDAKGLNARH